jgi:hypothetical protein
MNKILFAFFALAIFRLEVFAEEWHGIVPLRSTRADVVRLLGKPNELGRYEASGERADIIYSNGPCKGWYYPLEKANCKCLVLKDTVLSIYVEPNETLKFSKLRIDKSRFTRTAIIIGNGLFSYSNLTDGIVYTVDEAQDEVIDVEYLPSFADCQRVTTITTTPRNSWQGLIPLHSNRQGVEALLGQPGRTWERTHTYDAENEIVTVKYSNGNCDEPGTEWNVPKDTVLEFVVTPRLGFLLRQLNLDLNSYKRQELFPLPEIPNPPKVANYIDNVNGIIIRAQSNGGSEEVVSITYRPAKKDEDLRCTTNPKAANKRP